MMDEVSYLRKLYESLRAIDRKCVPNTQDKKRKNKDEESLLKDAQPLRELPLRMSVEELRESVSEAMNTVRLHVTYVAFNAEATERDNMYLRKMIERNDD